MKKKNGFTLIELLAVIIILGVLMLVAIPSVTSYINNSRKSAYADTAANYIKGATNLINEGAYVQAYDESVLYMIPVGHDKTKSCVQLESGGQSPYNNEYKMAYVGFTYDNEKGSYNYYFMAVDGSGQGLMFNSSYDVSGTTQKSTSGSVKRGADLIEAGLTGKNGQLETCYTGGSGCPSTDSTDFTSGSGIADIMSVANASITDSSKQVTKVRVIGVSKCNGSAS